MPQLNHEPLCERCNQPTLMIELVKPTGRRGDKDNMLPIPKRDKGIIKSIEGKSRNLVNLVCHRNDVVRFENEEWLLSGDGDVSWHTYYIVRDCIYSTVRVEY